MGHKDEMEEMYPDGNNFIHDNHTVHTSVEDWAEDEGFSFIQFPVYSPDLNPIENAWATLKRAFSGDAPQTEQDLIQSLESHWEKLTITEKLESYIQGLRKRYKELPKPRRRDV